MIDTQTLYLANNAQARVARVRELIMLLPHLSEQEQLHRMRQFLASESQGNHVVEEICLMHGQLIEPQPLDQLLSQVTPKPQKVGGRFRPSPASGSRFVHTLAEKRFADLQNQAYNTSSLDQQTDSGKRIDGTVVVLHDSTAGSEQVILFTRDRLLVNPVRLLAGIPLQTFTSRWVHCSTEQGPLTPQEAEQVKAYYRVISGAESKSVFSICRQVDNPLAVGENVLRYVMRTRQHISQ